ncbi:CUE domain-containing protein [Lachnellula suecica]|uniref:CUE domain-containing protein n=1 Tax=Lachnellula suecica TaxID=602035 RepID=A0A8T9CBA7_9HELO|nr:CUE domain-containing protein [Lachnellula suecica]
MSAPTKTTDSPLRSPTGAESPTTVRPLEMDDDDVQEAGLLAGDAPAASKPAPEETAPPKPPRPLSPQQQAENTLKEAFPSIDAAVVKAVLSASGGRVEPAFNALLGMSDPDAVREETPPPQPPRPQAQRVGSTPLTQLEADEQYARQLAEHYGGGGGGGAGYAPRGGNRGPPRQQKPNAYEEEEHSFIDDDLPIIKENLKKGFFETQTKVNGWITNLRKKIDGEEEEQGSSSVPQGYHNQQYGSRRSGDGRQSGDYNRYDADPHVLGDDFAGIQLNDDGSAARRSTRPLANPDLFKPTPTTPKSSDGRKVQFSGGPPEDMDIYRTSPRLGAKETSPAPVPKQSKWQPLSAVDPSPLGEADHDPFSLGDSEDEKESKDRVGGKEIKMDDAERLKKAAAEAMSENIAEPARKPEPAETTGTKDKIAEDLATKS